MAIVNSTVAVVDDDPETRATLQIALQHAGLRSHIFDRAESCLTVFPLDRPACLVLDYQLPGMNGLELQELLASRGMLVPTILVTGQGTVRTAVQALRTGAVDVLEKPVSIPNLLRSVQQALLQDAASLQRQVEQERCASRLMKLSPREREIMIRLARNQSAKQIAADLGISAKTVGVHRMRIMSKLEADGIAELTTVAHRMRLID